MFFGLNPFWVTQPPNPCPQTVLQKVAELAREQPKVMGQYLDMDSPSTPATRDLLTRMSLQQVGIAGVTLQKILHLSIIEDTNGCSSCMRARGEIARPAPLRLLAGQSLRRANPSRGVSIRVKAPWCFTLCGERRPRMGSNSADCLFNLVWSQRMS